MTATLQVVEPNVGLAAVDRLVTGEVEVTAQATLVGDRATVTQADLRVESAGLTITGSGEVDLATRAGRGTLATDLASLGPFGPLVDLPLSGSVIARADWILKPEAISADVQVMTDALAGLPVPAPALLGAAPTLSAAVIAAPDRSVRVQDLSVQGAAVALHGEAALISNQIDAVASVALTDLQATGAPIEGETFVTAALEGPLLAPRVDLSAVLPRGQAAGLILDGVALNAELRPVLAVPSDTDTPPAWSVTAAGDGRVGSVPMRIAIAANAVSPSDTGPIRLQVRAPGADLDATARWRPDPGPEATLALTIADLAPIASPFIGPDLRGQAALNARLTPNALEVTANLQDAAAQAVTIDDARLVARVDDLLTQPTISAQLAARDIAGPATIETAVLTLEGPPEALALGLTVRGEAVNQPITLTTEARVQGAPATPESPLRIDLARLEAGIGAGRIALESPVRITPHAGGAAWTPLTLTSTDGTVSVTGAWPPGPDDLVLTVTDVTPGIVGWIADPLPFAGRLNAVARLSGDDANRQAAATITINDVVPDDPRFAGFGAGNSRADLQWDGASLGFDAELASPRLGGVSATGQLAAPLVDGWPRIDPDAAISAIVRGTLDFTAFTLLLAADGSQVGGTAMMDLALSGPLSAPQADGSLTITDGLFISALTGMRVTDLGVRMTGGTAGLVIEYAEAQTTDGGTITVGGAIGLGPGLPVDLRIALDGAQVADLDTVEARISSDLSLTGPVLSRPQLIGEVTSDLIIVRLPDQLPISVTTLPVTERGGNMATAPDPTPTTPAIVADLELEIALPRRVFVRGRGLDAELAGALTVGGTSAAPDVVGAVRLVEGDITLAGAVITLTEGLVTFDGGRDLDPQLALIASRPSGDATVRVEVSGRASSPQITFGSDPPLPQDEVLARLLFGVPATALTATQAVQLGLAAAQISGIGGSGPGVVDRVRRGLRLDRLDVAADAETGTASLGAETRITDRISLGVEQGTGAETSRARVEFDLTPDIAIEAETGTNAQSRIGLRWQREY